MHRKRIVLIVVGMVVGGLIVTEITTRPRTDRGASIDSPADSIRTRELETLDQDIAFFTERAERDPESAMDRASLAARLLQRARETGSDEDNRRAEDWARQSLTLRLANNAGTYSLLASSLLAQHRFAEALAAAHELLRADSTATPSLALIGEIYLELGAYDSARAIFGPLYTRRDLAIAPRLARWAELSGHLDQAQRIFDDAIRQLPEQPNLRSEQVAWFYLRKGELAVKHGQLTDAERAFRAGLAIRPRDHRLLAAVAKLELLRSRPERAIDYGERALAARLDPATLGIIADAYRLLGDSAKAEEYARALEVTVVGTSGAPFHRAWSLFLLDHDRRVAEVLASAENEITLRRDVYGYDLLAWALYKSGRYSASRAAISSALALGTEDAMLFYHAGMIERAVGEVGAARRYFDRALSLNPHFHATQPAIARELLRERQAAGDQ